MASTTSTAMATDEQLSTAKNDTGSVKSPLKIKVRIPQHVKNKNDPADYGAAARTAARDPSSYQKLPHIAGPQKERSTTHMPRLPIREGDDVALKNQLS